MLLGLVLGFLLAQEGLDKRVVFLEFDEGLDVLEQGN